MIAFVDESIRETGVGMYVVAAVIAPVNECGDLREGLTKRGRFHFYKAGEARRAGMLRAIKSCRLGTSAYVYRGLFPIGQENARARCLRSLLRDLKAWGVDELVIESRHGRADLWDRITIMSALNSQTAPDALAYKWEGANDEPMLWMADAIAGAVRANAEDDRYAEVLERMRTAIRQVI